MNRNPYLSSFCYMKIISHLFFLMIFFPAIIFSQGTNTIKVKKVKKITAQTQDGQLTIYKGADNPVYFLLINDTAARLAVTGSKNTRITGKNHRYSVKADSGKIVTFFVSQVMPNGTKNFIDSVRMFLKPIPPPLVTVAGRFVSDTISQSVLLSARSIQLLQQGFKCDCPFTIVSFDMAATVGGVMIDMRANGNVFTNEMMTVIGKLKTKNKVYFENVTVKSQDGMLRKIPGVYFTIN